MEVKEDDMEVQEEAVVFEGIVSKLGMMNYLHTA